MSAASTRSTTPRMKFDIRFYLVAILFIIFDLEVAFLFPVGGLLRGHRHGSASGR